MALAVNVGISMLQRCKIISCENEFNTHLPMDHCPACQEVHGLPPVAGGITTAAIQIPSGDDQENVQEGPKHGHYFKDVSHLYVVDVYRVLQLFNVTDPCLQHAVKKILCPGERGAKDRSKDIREAKDSLQRWEDMTIEDRGSTVSME